MWLPTLFLVLVATTTTRCQLYDHTQKIFDVALGKARYNPDVRPTIDQSSAVLVYVSFELLSIVEVNDITQSFICNGIAQMNWEDQRAAWNTSDYGGVESIHPSPKLIWRPRVVLVNTLGKRDLFEDDYSPTKLYYDGHVTWFPGSLFPTACKLDLTKYPFDKQRCFIRMLPMALMTHELLFIPGAVLTSSYTENGAWDVVDHYITNDTVVVDENGEISYFEVVFYLKRRPTFFILNVLLPVVLLSFLNIMVFAIPVDSGEKISYGITVLLALTVFISIVSSMLPKSSDTIPHVIIYLFALLVVSLLTVVDSIVIVFLYHMEVKKDRSIKARHTFRTAISTVNAMSGSVSPLGVARDRSSSINDPLGTGINDNPMFQNTDIFRARSAKGHHRTKNNSWADVMREVSEDGETKRPVDDGGDIDDDDDERVNKYKTIGKYIDFISFIVFIIIWLILTLWIFIEIAS